MKPKKGFKIWRKGIDLDVSSHVAPPLEFFFIFIFLLLFTTEVGHVGGRYPYPVM